MNDKQFNYFKQIQAVRNVAYMALQHIQCNDPKMHEYYDSLASEINADCIVTIVKMAHHFGITTSLALCQTYDQEQDARRILRLFELPQQIHSLNDVLKQDDSSVDCTDQHVDDGDDDIPF